MKVKKLLAGLLTAAMIGTMMMGCSSSEEASTEGDASAETTQAAEETTEETAEEAEVLPGGGSNIIYVITPSVSNPAFKTEADTATAKAEELGYEVKAASHDDDPTKQTELFDNAIADKAAAIICDNAGADATVEAVRKAREAGFRLS